MGEREGTLGVLVGARSEGDVERRRARDVAPHEGSRDEIFVIRVVKQERRDGGRVHGSHGICQERAEVGRSGGGKDDGESTYLAGRGQTRPIPLFRTTLVGIGVVAGVVLGTVGTVWVVKERGRAPERGKPGGTRETPPRREEFCHGEGCFCSQRDELFLARNDKAGVAKQRVGSLHGSPELCQSSLGRGGECGGREASRVVFDQHHKLP